MAYVDIPQTISSKELLEKDCNLSSSVYKRLLMKNTNYKTLGELLETYQSGKEVGSLAYVEKSPFKFIRTKAINTNLFCLDFSTQGAIEYIKPDSYKIYFKEFMDLQKGDILFVTGGNVGEVAFIDKDYTNLIFSSHIIKLKTLENPYYIFAMLKHNICKEQVNFSPTGAIKGLDTFKVNYLLNCKIPFPNHNKEQTIDFIETLTKSIIKKEALIKTRHKEILNLIESELLNNQLPNTFTYTYPNIKELQIAGRLDTGIYCEEFKRIDFLIKNYKNGVFYIDKGKIKSGSTPKTRFIGKEEFLKYQWITPSHCSDYGTIKEEERINFIGKPNLTQDCILLINRGQGQDCGKGIFYSFADSKTGQHNQGMYRIFNYPKIQMLFMMCFLNAEFMRRYCAYFSLGSKMRELKRENFLQIPFPNFPQNLQEKIAKLYHNPNVKLENLSLDNFTQSDEIFCQNAGIYELDLSIKQLKTTLNRMIDDIINE